MNQLITRGPHITVHIVNFGYNMPPYYRFPQKKRLQQINIVSTPHLIKTSRVQHVHNLPILDSRYGLKGPIHHIMGSPGLKPC